MQLLIVLMQPSLDSLHTVVYAVERTPTTIGSRDGFVGQVPTYMIGRRGPLVAHLDFMKDILPTLFQFAMLSSLNLRNNFGLSFGCCRSRWLAGRFDAEYAEGEISADSRWT